jgi:hypothetical protein
MAFELVENALFMQGQCTIQRSLTTKCAKNAGGPFLFNDLLKLCYKIRQNNKILKVNRFNK